MGSGVEINDTLQITSDQGFPHSILNREAHLKNPITAQQLEGKIFEFRGKPGARLFQLAPVRVYLVHNLAGKWLFWGKIAVIEQSITQILKPDEPWKPGDWQTSGRYTALEIYEPTYQELFTKRESPAGLSYFQS
jgi:hypothetical protein